MSSLKSWLARKAAGLIASDPEAVAVIAAEAAKANASAGMDDVRRGVCESIAKALTDFDDRLDRSLPNRIANAKRRYG